MNHILIIAILFSFSIKAFCCSCAGKSGIDDADFMFRGIVKSIKKESTHWEVTLKVRRIHKGGTLKKGSLIKIRTGASQANCGILFIRPFRYAVYAYN